MGPNLPLSYRRLQVDDVDPAIAGIVVDPRSSGRLDLPGSYSAKSPPPAYRCKITATDKSGVDVASVQTGTSAEYVVRIDVRNRRDSPSVVKLYWVDH